LVPVATIIGDVPMEILHDYAVGHAIAFVESLVFIDFW
jgi:hypothetical protein